MEVQPQLILLQKTLLNIEGLGRQLDPDLDLWETAKPFLDRWMSEQVGVRALALGLRKQLPRMAERLPEIPDLVYSTLKKFEQGQAKLEWHSQELELIRKEIKTSNRNLILTLLLAAAGLLFGMWYF